MLKLFFMVLMSVVSFYCKGMEMCTITHHAQSGSKNYEYLLACTVSKTNTVIGIFIQENEKLILLLEIIRKTVEINDFTQFITDILHNVENHYKTTIKRGCFGVPGNPSANNSFIQPFNISFAVDADTIRNNTNLEQILVVNDFEVVGYGIDVIDAQKVIQINPGVPRKTWPKAIVGAGDSLGSCLMVWDGLKNNYVPSPLGFCYMDFAAHDASDLELMNFIKQTSAMKNISWGYLLGLKGGIKKMYEFLDATQEYAENFVTYTTPQEIFDQAARSNIHCKNAVDLYMKLYIRLLRNVAYAELPYGGLYITNKVVEQNQDLFTAESFFTEMLNCKNDLLAEIIQDIPVYCVVEPKVKLYGAAQYILVNKICAK